MLVRDALVMSRISSLALLSLVVFTAPASAITARDVMESMTQKERFGYVTGLADMLSYQYVLAGDRPRAECITNAFYSQKEGTWKLVYDAFKRFPDKAPEGLVVVLMKQTCGK
jgi:hypothetical protein